MRVVLPLSLSAALLTACATPYAPQAGAPTAMVRFTSNVGDSFGFATTDLAQCPSPPTQDIGGINGLSPGEVSTLKMFGTSPKREGRMIERVIHADRPFPVLASSSRGATAYVPGYSCSVGRTFTPKAGHQYEVNYSYNEPYCRVEVVELVSKGDTEFQRVPEPSMSPLQGRRLQDFCVRK